MLHFQSGSYVLDYTDLKQNWIINVMSRFWFKFCNSKNSAQKHKYSDDLRETANISLCSKIIIVTLSIAKLSGIKIVFVQTSGAWNSRLGHCFLISEDYYENLILII